MNAGDSAFGSDARIDIQCPFILPNFQHKKLFFSFLLGVVGLHGIPMWVFYVNRVQTIYCFEVENKDYPVLEFQAANKAYQSVERLGFRTFVNRIDKFIFGILLAVSAGALVYVGASHLLPVVEK